MKIKENTYKINDDVLLDISKLISQINNSNQLEYLNLIFQRINYALSSNFSFIFLKSPKSKLFKLISETANEVSFNNRIVNKEIRIEKEYKDIYNQLSENLALSLNNNSFNYNMFETPINSILIFPMKISNSLIGFIGICDDNVNLNLSDKELSIFSNLFNYLGVVLFHLTTSKNISNLKKKIKSRSSVQSEFLSNISHEIRTPMNAIIGFAELLRNSQHLTDLQIKYLDGIAKGSQSLLTLINDILDLSKIEANQIKINFNKIDIRIILNDIKSIFQNASNFKGIKFNITIDDTIPENLLLDELRLRQILFNLVGNAIKFTDTGFVELSVQQNIINSHKLDLIFKIQDTGIGIQSAHIDEIFDAFKQIDAGKRKKYPGTGLGLAISKRLANIMGGTLDVESIEGAGSTFTLSLKNIQIFNRNCSDIEQNNISSDEKISNSLNLVIANDNSTYPQLFKIALKNYCVNIIEATSGKAVFNILAEMKPDIIFLDINLPELNGIETLKNIKLLYPELNIPIIALVAENEVDDSDFIKNNFNGILKKPFFKERLHEELSKFFKLQIESQSNHDCFISYDIDKLIKTISCSRFPIDFLDSFEIEFVPQYLSIRNSFHLSNIFHFIGYLKSISKKYNLDVFNSVIDSIYKNTKEFKIDKVYKIILDFNLIIEEIRKLKNNN